MGLAGYRELLKSETSVKICAMWAGLPVTRRIDRAALTPMASLGIAGIACLVPARRAAALDLNAALRDD